MSDHLWCWSVVLVRADGRRVVLASGLSRRLAEARLARLVEAAALEGRALGVLLERRAA